MATKFGSGYVSKYLVDLWTSPSDRPSPFGTCGQPGQTTSLLPTDHTLWPLAHRVHKGLQQPNPAKPEPKIFVHYSAIIPLISRNPVTSTSVLLL